MNLIGERGVRFVETSGVSQNPSGWKGSSWRPPMYVELILPMLYGQNMLSSRRFMLDWQFSARVVLAANSVRPCLIGCEEPEVKLLPLERSFTELYSLKGIDRALVAPTRQLLISVAILSLVNSVTPAPSSESVGETPSGSY